MNLYPSHVGSLTPIKDDKNGDASYATIKAMRPNLFPDEKYSIAARSMAVYERPNDFRAKPTRDKYNNGSMGMPIACCNVRLIQIVDDSPFRFLEDDAEGVEFLTLEDYRQLFGEDFDPAAWDDDTFAFDQD